MARRRPLGVTFLSLLALLLGLIYLLEAVAYLLVSMDADLQGLMEGRNRFLVDHAQAIFTSVGVALLILGIVFLLLCYGLLRGEWWAWTLGMVMGVISLVSHVANALVNISLSTMYTSVMGILLASLFLYYLSRRRVRWYFRI
ncbi:MAG: hypothetical protein ACLFUV_03710 [Methanomassiliicoccales archaeon]